MKQSKGVVKVHNACFALEVVRVKGLEPSHLAIPEPKSGASTNSATPARVLFNIGGGDMGRNAPRVNPIMTVN